jgi:Raf kinase inhibitor-like YbhB/YbcL family protein
MKLESDAFGPDGLIPQHYTCDGENISPSLRWDRPPDHTRSLVLIVDDPDAPGKTFVHWVLYDLPPETHNLPERVATQPKLYNGAIQGTNDFGRLGYRGPCPPSGTHRYFFKLYALDQRLGLVPGATKTQVVNAMENHVLASAELVGLYTRH